MRGKGENTTTTRGVDELTRSPRLLGESPGILVAAKQYNVANRIIDLCTFDLTQNPLRCGGLFDAIVTDPPCKSPLYARPLDYFHSVLTSNTDGVRAGAKRLGRKETDKRRERRDLSLERRTADGCVSSLVYPNYILTALPLPQSVYSTDETLRVIRTRP